MQKFFTISGRIAVVILLFCLYSTSARAQNDPMSEPPIATNSINAIGLSELNLSSGDYSLLKPITISVVISVEYKGKRHKIIQCEDEDFTLEYKWGKRDNGSYGWKIQDWEGVVKLGFLSNSIGALTHDLSAHEAALRLAKYRLISQAQMQGADGVIEPIFSTNVAQSGKKLFFKTTVTARPLVLKSR